MLPSMLAHTFIIFINMGPHSVWHDGSQERDYTDKTSNCYVCYSELLSQIIMRSRPYESPRQFPALLYINSVSTLSFLFHCGLSYYISILGEASLWHPSGLLPLKPLWRTLDPGRRSDSKPQSALFHPSLSLRNTASVSPRQNESLVLPVNQNSSNVSI